MYTHACPFAVLMPEEEEKGPGFSRSHKYLIITNPVHQWQGDNDAVKYNMVDYMMRLLSN